MGVCGRFCLFCFAFCPICNAVFLLSVVILQPTKNLSVSNLQSNELKLKTIIYLNVFNMNQTKGNKRSRFFALLVAGVLSAASLSAQAQNRTIKGCITDANNKEPLMGATITLDGGKTGAVTDLDGNYTLIVPAGTKQITVSYIGYIAKTVQLNGDVINITLDSNDRQLGEVVVVGYGTARKSDLTGSVATVSAKDFNKGAISSPEQLINGKVSGVQIMSNSGSATSGSTIRVRGGASLNASNDPLIVVDGVPLELGGISGADNFLSMINPQDIESMTVLKDAASTAIYGSRASNGVILITTKKGSDSKLNVQFSSTNTMQTRAQMVDILSAEEFRSVINAHGTDAQKALLGNANTDWLDEVYRTTLSTDNNLSLSGNIVKGLPFRASVGYANQNGIIRGDKSERFTGSIVLNPSLFNDHLKLRLNAKGSLTKNTFYNSSAIWAAATFNPTLPVHSGSDKLGGYTESLDASGNPINTKAGQRNPRGLVDMYDAGSDVKRFIGNFDVDYKLHFFPDIKLHATVGTDVAEGKGHTRVPEYAASNFFDGGYNYNYGPQKKMNNLLTVYANYGHYFEEAKSKREKCNERRGSVRSLSSKDVVYM
jgi:TonB-dependent starch-binding outer membrane protein SusC